MTKSTRGNEGGGDVGSIVVVMLAVRSLLFLRLPSYSTFSPVPSLPPFRSARVRENEGETLVS
jgi:hypothetical protein